mmetsp:Transcript_50253/g.162705  ORF Transcript_50253/g.162705 Transcript_50253/m.162705 type:complete len:429 (-) Transcript_50253:31-1317(-)
MAKTTVKNTFIDVQEEETSPKKREGRRNNTAPASGGAFAACMAAEESDDDEGEDEGPQPSLAFTKTFDPYDKTPGAKTRRTGAEEEEVVGEVRSKVKNTFVEMDDEEEGAQGGVARSKTTPSKKVGFLSCGAEESDEDEITDASNVGRDSQEEVQPGITTCKTYDRFEGSTPAAAHRPLPPMGTMPMAAMMPPQMPPQVFTIPIPAGMPVGASHAIQLPLGLPPGSTIVIMPTAMGHGAPSAGPASPTAMGRNHSAASNASAASAGAGAGATAGGGIGIMPQTIMKSLGHGGCLRIQYIVDARKLKANDKAVISPPFPISGTNPGNYRMIVNPTFVKARGGATFKNSGGLGNVQLKCEDLSEGTISFMISIGDGRPNSIRNEPARGPVDHDFADSSVCGLQKAQEEWDFNRAVDAASKTFSVFLDIAQ